MFEHDEWRLMISAYADGEATRAERKQAEAHLRECVDCREWLAQITADRQLYANSLRGRQVELSKSVMERVRMMPDTTTTVRPMPLFRPSRLIEALAAALLTVMLVAVFFPVFAKAREKARQTSCLSNVRQIMTAMLSYAQDYHGHLPESASWAQDVMPYMKNSQILICPTDETGASLSYGMVSKWSGADVKTIPDPADTVIIFDAENGRPAYRHNDGLNAGFADGHAKWLPQLPPDVAGTTAIVPGTPQRNYGLARQLQIAYDASCEIWVSHIQDAVVSAEQAFYDHGGFVLSSVMVQEDDPDCPRQAQITGKVPTDQVAATINALSAMGYVARREIQGQDMTDQYVGAMRDITTTHRKMEQITKRRAEAPVQAEAALEEARGELGTKQDAFFNVNRELALATISANLLEKAPAGIQAGSGIVRAWSSFVKSVLKIGVVLIWILLYGLFFMPAVFAYVVYRRRRRHN